MNLNALLSQGTFYNLTPNTQRNLDIHQSRWWSLRNDNRASELDISPEPHCNTDHDFGVRRDMTEMEDKVLIEATNSPDDVKVVF